MLSGLWFASNIALAADTTGSYQPLTGIYGITDSVGVETGDQRLTRMIQNAFNLLIGIAGLSAVVMISYGALMYMGESITRKETGKTTMWNAVVGLLLVLFTYTILFTINPNILNLKISPRDLGISDDPTQISLRGTIYTIENTTTARADCKKQGGTVIEPQTGESQLKCNVPPPTNVSQTEVNAGSNAVIYKGGVDGVAWCRGHFDASQLSLYATRCTPGHWEMQPTRTVTTYNTDGTSVSKDFHVGICRQEKNVQLTKQYTEAQLSSFLNWTIWAVISEEPAWSAYENGCSGNGVFTHTSTATLEGTGTFYEYVRSAKLTCEPGVFQRTLANKCLPPDHR